MVTRTLQSGPWDEYVILRICHCKHLPSAGADFYIGMFSHEPLCEVGPSARCPAPNNMPIFLELRETSCKSVLDKVFKNTVDDPFLLLDDGESNNLNSLQPRSMQKSRTFIPPASPTSASTVFPPVLRKPNSSVKMGGHLVGISQGKPNLEKM
ncbi:hypothetical protein PsorP6_011324 [Peronosclerospora sorghi]|uniref:Uncharacterized protein n=1 Tax=Peronosclerospora sorghi TaxID=230839 RepID=A0ACC0WKB2_9STRA|nr:hypothetical protein PsorP6_011324 [Peronosclerospora sorghi]